MPRRATKRGEERTELGGRRDVLICGASFAGLAIARELAGSGADVLIVDRYAIGERQTSACGVPTVWLEHMGLMEAEQQRFPSVVVHSPHGGARFHLPWSFSTFDYRTVCELLWRDCDATFETAKVNRRLPHGANGGGEEQVGVETDRGVLTAPLVVDALGWRRVLTHGAVYQPPDAPLSRGLEVHPRDSSPDMEVWIDRRYVPAGYGWIFPAGEEVRVGVGSFTPDFNVRPTTDVLADDLGVEKVAYQGNWIPHKLRTATEGGVFFCGDSAGHCLPLTAEGIRPALYFGEHLGRQLRAVVDGEKTRERAMADYAAFHDSHRWKFETLLKAQRLLPRIPPRMVAALLKVGSNRGILRWSFDKYLGVTPIPGGGRHRPQTIAADPCRSTVAPEPQLVERS